MNQQKHGTQQKSNAMKTIDHLISRELLKLSYNDRNAVNEEIHGVKCLAVEETPELLRTSLKAFQWRLDAMPPSKKEAYINIVRMQQQQQQQQHHVPYRPRQRLKQQQQQQLHQMMDSNEAHEPLLTADTAAPYTFINDENFRLRFLRCELFNVEKAALRFVQYLNLSYELFGAVALTRQVRISDLSKSDIRFMRRGHIQILPYRDRAGRRVIVWLGVGSKGGLGDAFVEMVKCFFYIRDAATRDSVECQRAGIVFVVDVTIWRNGNINVSPQFYTTIKKVVDAVPTRAIALHVCCPHSPSFWTFNIINQMTFGMFMSRIRAQVGNEIETRYKLRGYGIPIHLLPLTETGAIKVKYFHEWLRICRTLEESSEEEYAADDNALARVVICPGLTDVVFRQGTPSMKNPGNVIFRDTMIAHLEDHHAQHWYLEGHQQQPDQIEIFCNWLIENTKNTKGGRFLEWDKRLNVWVRMVDRQKIKSKVAIGYRDTTKRFLNHRQKLILQSTNAQAAAVAEKGATTTETGSTDQDVSDSNEGSYAFVEGGKNGKMELCAPSKSKPYTSQTINATPSRGDSNYNESSGWF